MIQNYIPTLIILFGIVWVIVARLTYGMIFAFDQRHYKILAEESYDEDKWWAFVWALLTPFGTFFGLMYSKGIRYGFKFK